MVEDRKQFNRHGVSDGTLAHLDQVSWLLGPRGATGNEEWRRRSTASGSHSIPAIDGTSPPALPTHARHKRAMKIAGMVGGLAVNSRPLDHGKR